MPLQIECMLDLRARHATGNFFVFKNQITEIQIFFPSAHGVRLDHAIRVFARNSMLDQIEQELSAEHQPACALEITLHALGVDEHCVDEV